ncbi:MAG: alpha/beta hydrolase fold domain-containing protein [Pseudomonadota bacterium]|uniref:alpha/beta hydrolase fold domain-containing protein n=1 Tax=Hyphomonas sp. BRH_c22 TaxID=1629710 RepID=UPI000B0EB1FF|nr:alpha/beta hydrolase fold domain-containing protein [Hyphomonas sp. BRH_c22]
MRLIVCLFFLAACATPLPIQVEQGAPPVTKAPLPMVVVREADVISEEAPPHGALGMSTAYRISDAAPGRTMEFRRRDLHPGSAIGEHVIAHDEVYYVLSGQGEVFSDGTTAHLTAGMAAYLYTGANVGIRQTGDDPLSLIISYPKSLGDDDALLVDLDRQPDETIPLWPDGPPGGVPDGLAQHYVIRDNPYGLVDRAFHDVTDPALAVFRPEHPDGSALLLIPGGGYKWVVVEKEGYEGARWFARRGTTVYVLSYRLPHQGWAAGPDTPLQDAQRAMRLIRARAGDSGIDPSRVMLMGFSAGGHLAGSLTTRFAAEVYAPVDAADTLSARPDASVLVYPVITLSQPHTHGSTSQNMIGATSDADTLAKYSVETSVPAGAPPVFILHAGDDDVVPVENALIAYDAFRKAGVKASLHIFEHGGHGFGLRGIDTDPLRVWPELVRDWGVSEGIFTD